MSRIDSYDQLRETARRLLRESESIPRAADVTYSLLDVVAERFHIVPGDRDAFHSILQMPVMNGLVVAERQHVVEEIAEANRRAAAARRVTPEPEERAIQGTKPSELTPSLPAPEKGANDQTKPSRGTPPPSARQDVGHGGNENHLPNADPAGPEARATVRTKPSHETPSLPARQDVGHAPHETHGDHADPAQPDVDGQYGYETHGCYAVPSGSEERGQQAGETQGGHAASSQPDDKRIRLKPRDLEVIKPLLAYRMDKVMILGKIPRHLVESGEDEFGTLTLPSAKHLLAMGDRLDQDLRPIRAVVTFLEANGLLRLNDALGGSPE